MLDGEHRTYHDLYDGSWQPVLYNTELNYSTNNNVLSSFFFARSFRYPLKKASGEFVHKRVS